MTKVNVNEAVCDAIFASALEPSDGLTAETLTEAIGCTVRQLGPAGCAGVVAEQFGDHPEAAAARMRWVRQVVNPMCGCLFLPAAEHAATEAADAGLLAVRAAA